MHIIETVSKSRRRFLGTVSGLMTSAMALGVSDAKAVKTKIRHVVNDIEADSVIRSTPRRKRDIFLEKIDDHYVLSDGKTSKPVLELNHTGQIVWNLCDGNKSPLEISHILHQVYFVDPHKAQVDCLCFLAELNRNGLIQL
jgi:hypothetical protein